ncbi:hypothetical protein E6R62_29195 [Streptomyces sp. A1136]|nr:hypothetical protein E6R62_29195 [Streptomyces sp. A1136]
MLYGLRLPAIGREQPGRGHRPARLPQRSGSRLRDSSSGPPQPARPPHPGGRAGSVQSLVRPRPLDGLLGIMSRDPAASTSYLDPGPEGKNDNLHYLLKERDWEISNTTNWRGNIEMQGRCPHRRGRARRPARRGRRAGNQPRRS